MKYLLFTIALFICTNITAQELPKKSKIFVRVYNNQGKKIAKGKILDITDNSLTLKKGSGSITIPLSEIETLKTKRSNGNNVLFGAAGGFLLGLGIVASNSGPCDGLGCTGKGIAYVGAIILPMIGSGIGYLTTLFKNSKEYLIVSDVARWKGFMEDMYQPQN